MNDMSLCYILTIVASVALTIYGLMDILRKQQADELTQNEVISRQIRGFGILVLAQVVLLVGGATCAGLSSGLEKLMKDVSRLFQ